MNVKDFFSKVMIVSSYVVIVSFYILFWLFTLYSSFKIFVIFPIIWLFSLTLNNIHRNIIHFIMMVFALIFLFCPGLLFIQKGLWLVIIFLLLLFFQPLCSYYLTYIKNRKSNTNLTVSEKTINILKWYINIVFLLGLVFMLFIYLTAEFKRDLIWLLTIIFFINWLPTFIMNQIIFFNNKMNSEKKLKLFVLWNYWYDLATIIIFVTFAYFALQWDNWIWTWIAIVISIPVVCYYIIKLMWIPFISMFNNKKEKLTS